MNIWVIGGTSGIGSATAIELAKRGHAVFSTGKEDVDVQSASALQDYLGGPKQFHGIVYAAGINRLAWDHELNIHTAMDIFDVNVFGFMRVIRLIAQAIDPIHDAPPARSLVAVSSDAATRPMRTSMAYCASKAALNACVKQAARELAPYVRVNAVAPGMTEGTGMTAYIDQAVTKLRGWTRFQAREYEESQIPARRRGTPAEMAHVIADVLLGPDYQTGAIVEVNGGR
jgi:NAD(P)-dependent dehydrogenase (short-subunit alcohol dehydrogenase family)